jgi:5-dehydro-4-deoxyglucarate dehydratase
MANLDGPFDGVMFFPVTPFGDNDRVELDVMAEHLEMGISNAPAAIFAACGTGEFHALSVSEYREVLAQTVAVTAGRVPVVGGVGGPLGHAREVARAAEEAGADALLVLPPYLVGGPQAGLVAYVEAVAAATQLPLIVYNRGVATFSADSIARLLANPQVIGLKDGVGDIALAQTFVRLAEASGRNILLFNGLLTAELSQAAYRGIGMPLYSSAVFAMAPEIANGFFRAYQVEDAATQARLLDGFYVPLVRLRDETPGFAVSLIKAGLRLGGLPVGSVRAPLVDPSPEQLARLANLLEIGRSLVS